MMGGSAERRYQEDPQFHALVDMIYQAIVEKNYTATEVREAAMLAAIKYEQMHIREFGTFPEQPSTWLRKRP